MNKPGFSRRSILSALLAMPALVLVSPLARAIARSSALEGHLLALVHGPREAKLIGADYIECNGISRAEVLGLVLSDLGGRERLKVVKPEKLSSIVAERVTEEFSSGTTVLSCRNWVISRIEARLAALYWYHHV